MSGLALVLEDALGLPEDGPVRTAVGLLGFVLVLVGIWALTYVVPWAYALLRRLLGKEASDE